MAQSGPQKVLRFLASVKLAVIVITALAAACAAATFVESLSGTKAAIYHVYGSLWFKGILFGLGVNILAVMVDRWPWKMRHTPFLLAHIGILLLLFGSWVTQKFGLDGSLRIAEGETSSEVQIDEPTLYISDQKQGYRVPLRWTPRGSKFAPVQLQDYGVPYQWTVEDFISESEPLFSFGSMKGGAPAIQLKIMGGPMQIVQDYWLWGADPSWSMVQAGPARLILAKNHDIDAMLDQTPGPWLAIYPGDSSSTQVFYRARNSQGKRVKGKARVGSSIQPGWKGVAVQVVKYLPESRNETSYKWTRFEMNGKGRVAVRIRDHKRNEDFWLGMGDRTRRVTQDGGAQVALYPKRVMLPFSLQLKEFRIHYWDGTRRPKSYESDVKIIGETSGVDTKISMNEPAVWGGITFYQASYEDGKPRPTVSIFSVNRDPGRVLKYLGSLLIVLGSIVLFAVKYRKSKSVRK